MTDNEELRAAKLEQRQVKAKADRALRGHHKLMHALTEAERAIVRASARQHPVRG